MSKDEEVKGDFEDFWQAIVCNPDGSLNGEQVKKELYDFHMVMQGASKVYCELTNSRISKPNTDPDVVIQVVNDIQAANIREAIKDEKEIWDTELEAKIAQAKGG